MREEIGRAPRDRGQDRQDDENADHRHDDPHESRPPRPNPSDGPGSKGGDEAWPLVGVLRQAPGIVGLRHAIGQPESQQYRDQIAAVLEEAGWTINPIPKFLIQENDGERLWILVNDMARAPQSAIMLQAAFRTIGIEAPGVAVPGSTDGAIDLYGGTPKKQLA